ncbi:PLP-dependent aminotransferase family protein [Pseudomonas sp. BW16M2]|uniref:aminotransferase-like domain-containing protein n=1 Tax=Pseudomonas sp. BW16M2 TaxID=2745489 RepID=UPI0016495EE1|nr:PLP-dependent aminotransferase family protein [Pseudomonas sp. BW16M2]MBC3436716.1 PLP-dependent aminotransferase family protein [Pseudomonas sp. BW16M2]
MDTERAPRFTYQKVHRYLSDWLDARTPELEHRLPSLRDVARHLQVSLSTSKQAFALLEAQGRIQARPKVGYFSVALASVGQLPPSLNLIDRLYASARQPGMLALSSDSPTMLASLEGPLLTVERELLRQLPRADAPPFSPCGESSLREALARCYSRSVDDHWQADQVFIGADWRSVFELAVRTLLPPGARVLVESPCSWLVLRLLQAAGLNIVEAPLGADGRFDLEAMARLLAEKPVQAAVLSSTVNIPQGGVMPVEDKQRLCALLAEHQAWLFENDSYGALCDDPARSRYRDHANPQRLLVLAGFDKCIGAEAPFGYLLCRGAAASLAAAFLAQGFRLPSYRQQAVARLLVSGRLARHQVQLIRHLAHSRQRMAQLLQRHAGDCLRLSMPVAGATFWLQALRPVDMQAVCEQLLEQGIVIVPGTVFSRAGYWRDHLRLSFTVDWQQDIEGALVSLAQAIRRAPQQP